jgi:hypothetical protein
MEANAKASFLNSLVDDLETVDVQDEDVVKDLIRCVYMRGSVRVRTSSGLCVCVCLCVCVRACVSARKRARARASESESESAHEGTADKDALKDLVMEWCL